MELFKKVLFFSFISLAQVLANKGDLTFFIFEKDLPAEGIKVVVISDGNQEFKTDDNGMISTSLKEGSYSALIYNNEKEYQEVSFQVVREEETSINYTILNKGNGPSEVLMTGTSKEAFLDKKAVPGHQFTFKGVVLSFQKKLPVKGARVIVHGENIETVSNDKGEFELQIPEGEFDLSFIHTDFSSTTLRKMKFSEQREIRENVFMKPSGLELEEFVVISPSLKSSVSALLEVRKGHQSVADLIGSEQISKSGDSDAGSSLRRVTGLSLVDGKYIYIRGLGERYSNTLLNSSMLPSPDPSRRVVPLDLFPASVIESMVVQKGYSPEMPGDFGGGTIEIKTKTFPSKNNFSISLSEDFTNLRGAEVYAGGDRDWLGVDDGRRSMPQGLRSALERGINITKLSSIEKRALAKEINRSYNTEAFSRKSNDKRVPNFSLSAGRRLKLGKLRLGGTLSTIYSNKWTLENQERSLFNVSQIGGLSIDSQKNVRRSENKVKLGGLLGIGAKYKKQEISYNASLLRNTLNFVQQSNGVNSEEEKENVTELGFRERSIETHQLSGKHQIKALNRGTLNWNYTYSKAELSEPDNKLYTYIDEGRGPQFETENGSSTNNIAWREMPDRLSNIGLSYEQPIFSLFGPEQVKIKAGVSKLSRARQFSSNTFFLRFQNVDPDVLLGRPDDIIDDDSAELEQQASETDNYSSAQSVDSYFTNLTIPISQITVNAGVRYEKSVQEVNSFKLFNAGRTQTVLETKNYLPAVSMNIKLASNLQFRSNYSETVSRPDLREISKTTWNDVELGARYRGNPRLTAAQIKNYGGRLEWFFGRGEILSVGYFQKNFINPIEEIFGSLNNEGDIIGTTETQYTFFNIDSATSYGLEFEFRKNVFADITFGGNYSWIKSEVDISDERQGQLTNSKRPLQGQSPYLLNLQLDYESAPLNTTLSLLYNAIGRRITGVGTEGRPDEYQEKIETLDLVASKGLYRNWKIKLRAKNIFNPEQIRRQGGEITRLVKRGREFSLGLKGSF